MPRRGTVVKREIEPDVKYSSELVTRLISKVMQRGKKSTARRVVYEAFDIVEERMGRNPLEIAEQAIKNTTPMLEVKPPLA